MRKVLPTVFKARIFKNTLHVLGAMAVTAVTAQAAAVFLEQGGRVVIEAEHFDTRVANADGHHWQVIPGDTGTPVDNPAFTFTNPRGGQYLQSLPDVFGAGLNYNQPGNEVGPPTANYKVKITTAGNYRLWLKWGGYDGASDSIYAAITEVTSPGWYRYVTTIGSDIGAAPWQGNAAPNDNGAGGAEVPAVYDNLAAGTYTIRVTQREDGSGLDAIILQLASLPDPTGIGPAESLTEGNTIPVVAPVITLQPSDTTGAAGGTATFRVGVLNNTVPSGIQWFKNNVEIPGANDLSFTTPVLAAADNGAKYKVTLSNSAGSVTSTEGTLSVVDAPFTPGVLLYEYFPGSTRPAVEAGIAGQPSYAGNTVGSDRSGNHTIFESGVNFADNYANRFSGFFVPPTTGNYIFFLSGDDDSDLFLSTDDSPLNKKLIAQEVSWSNNRQWNTAGGGTSTVEAKRSDQFTGTQWPGGNTITLTANRRYYIEGVHHEGGGGDDFGATYKLESEDDALVADGTPSRLTGSVIGLAVPQVMTLGGATVGFKALTFNVTDVGPSVIDPASARVTFDGQSVTATAGPKSNLGVTPFTYTYPARLAAGSTHSYSIQVRDTAGRPVNASGTVTMPMPIFPSANLAGPAPVDKKWAVRFIHGVTDAAGAVVQMTGLPNIFNQIAAAGGANFNGTVTDTTSEVVNWNTAGFMGNNIPYPDEAVASGTCCTDDFINLNIGHLSIPEEGDYTFGIHSDDGFGFRIRGGEAISISGAGQIDLAAPEGVVHPADTGDSNTRVVYHLKKGVYRIEFFWWERGGGDFGELYAAKGAFVNDGDTPTWRLVGSNVPGQDIVSLGVDAAGWTVISSNPGGDPLNTWADADADLTATGGGAKNYDRLDIGDPETNAGRQAFPKNTPADDEDFAMRANATLVVPSDGTYVIGFNSDDGAYVKITGRTFTEIIQNNTGTSALNGDTVTCDCLTGDSGTTATITLTQGTYPIEAGMFERGGGAFLTVKGGKAGASPLSTGDLPVLAKGGAGVVIRTPEALQLTSAPTGIDPGGTGPTLTVAKAGNSLTISWAPTGGTLESTTALGANATWTAVGTANPATVSIGTGQVFYRVRR